METYTCKCGKKSEKKYCNTFCQQIDYHSYSGETYKETIKRLKKKNCAMLKNMVYLR